MSRVGLFWGASVDLWRRVAEARHWHYDLVRVGAMDEVLGGVADGRYDAAVGAITIAPERLAQVDFSYATHRSGVAVAVLPRAGLLAAFAAYGAVAGQLGTLVLLIAALLLATGHSSGSLSGARTGARRHPRPPSARCTRASTGPSSP